MKVENNNKWKNLFISIFFFSQSISGYTLDKERTTIIYKTRQIN